MSEVFATSLSPCFITTIEFDLQVFFCDVSLNFDKYLTFLQQFNLGWGRGGVEIKYKNAVFFLLLLLFLCVPIFLLLFLNDC